MGDVAMTVPVIRAFVKQFPQVKLTVVSRPFFKPFFDGIPNVDFFAVDVQKRHKGFFGLLQLYFDLKKLNVDGVADLHNVLRSKVVRTLFALSGKKVAFTDKGRAEKKALTSLKNKVFKPLIPMVERHVETFEKLGFSVDLTNFQFPDKAVLSEEILNITGTKNQNWVGIAPFAQYQSKVYPLDLMQQLIDALAENNAIKIFLFGGGKEEIQKLNQLQNNHSNVVVLAGKLKFNQELEVISNLDVMLSMDSGNGHIAAMLGVKVITLWGATHPFAGFAPFNQPLENCITADREKFPLIPTSIYGNKKVEGYEDAMRSITVEKVVVSVQSQLGV
jgi:ADP-heptose:LPS heptosyltransferase